MDVRLSPCIVENAYGQCSPSLLRAGASPEQLEEGRLDEQKTILATSGLLVLDHHQLSNPILVDGGGVECTHPLFVGGEVFEKSDDVADIYSDRRRCDSATYVYVIIYFLLQTCIVENAYGQRSPSLLRAGASPEQLEEGRLDEQKTILATSGLLVFDHHQLSNPILVDFGCWVMMMKSDVHLAYHPLWSNK